MKNAKVVLKNRTSDIDKTLSEFDSVSLKDMKSASLMDRAETKYVVNHDLLLKILPRMIEGYNVLEIEGQRKNNYSTVYFDTLDFDMYKRHHNGLVNRYKVRVRKYKDSKLSFMEVKFKNNKDKTVKKRIPLSEGFEKSKSNADNFIKNKSPFNSKDLFEVLLNNYKRITFVNKSGPERVTIDFDLEFYNITNKKDAKFPNFFVVEVKKENHSQRSEFVNLMHEFSVRPSGFSKYCIGIASTHNGLKTNNFKKNFLMLNKICGVKK